MKPNIKKLLIALAVPLAVGGLSALISGSGMADYAMLNKPPLSPPAWVFPLVWTILYSLMGFASYRVWTSVTTYEKRKNALFVYGVQLFFNFVWSIIFFNLKEFFFAFVWLAALWLLIYLTIKQFALVDKLASYLLLPYLLWASFAAYLNAGIYLLN